MTSITAPTPIWSSSMSSRTLQASESTATLNGASANVDNTRVQVGSNDEHQTDTAISASYNLPWLGPSLKDSHVIAQSQTQSQAQAPSVTPTWSSSSSSSRGPIDDDQDAQSLQAGLYPGQRHMEREGYVSWARRSELGAPGSATYDRLHSTRGRTPSPLPPTLSPSPSPSDGTSSTTNRIWTADRRSWYCGDCGGQNGFQADICGRCVLKVPLRTDSII